MTATLDAARAARPRGKFGFFAADAFDIVFGSHGGRVPSR